MTDYIYDIETYPNIFTCTFRHATTGELWVFEISDRKHQGVELFDFFTALKNTGARMVGFNNIGFDYPICHLLITRKGMVTCDELYQKCQSIIFSNDSFGHMVWESDWYVPQVDLFKIHHFDNKARSTSLKDLEFNMRSWTIEDLPYAPGTRLVGEQMDHLIHYNIKDVDETLKFYNESTEMIKMREELSVKYDRNFVNHNDTKVGKDYFIMCLEEAMPGSCYDFSTGKKVIRQTHRPQIALKDAVFDYVQYNQPEFNRILQWFKSQVITETVGVFTDISCTVNGFKFDFGLGGIHGSVESSIICSDDEYVIVDLDAKSYYPDMAIQNSVFPHHLSKVFCDIYKDVFNQRQQFGKNTPENAMLKLALNGVYGDSNNVYSPFYDPLYTMTITINGQLLLCMLAEYLMYIPGLQMIQVNTDGLTVKIPRNQIDQMTTVTDWWQKFTGLTLERVDYSRMFIRDVNNYIGEYTDGKVKRKGAYEYDMKWHQDHSQLVVPKAAEAFLLHGIPVEEFIRSHTNPMDFMIRAKAPRGAQIELDGVKQQRVNRFYVSVTGGNLEKASPPPPGCVPGEFKKANGVSDEVWQKWRQDSIALNGTVVHHPAVHTKNKSIYDERRQAVCKGWQVTVCNDLSSATVPINYEYYIAEARKLTQVFLGTS